MPPPPPPPHQDVSAHCDLPYSNPEPPGEASSVLNSSSKVSVQPLRSGDCISCRLTFWTGGAQPPAATATCGTMSVWNATPHKARRRMAWDRENLLELRTSAT